MAGDEEREIEVDIQQALQLLQQLYQRWCEEIGMPLDAASKELTLVQFAEWFSERAVTTSVEQVEQLCNEAQVSMDVWLGLQMLCSDAKGLSRLALAWPQVILAHRDLKDELESVNMALLLRWKDGKAVVLTQVAMARMLTPLPDGTPSKFTDGNVGTFVNASLPNVHKMLISPGIQELHDKVAFSVGLADFQEFLRHANHSIMSSGDAALQTRMLEVQSLLAGLFCPEEILAQRKKRAAQPPAAPKSGPELMGGWG